MCGIAGVIQFSKQASLNSTDYSSMKASLRHRGPDQEGEVCGDHFYIAHTRLSIVDVDGPPQPFYSMDQKSCISFNGEIYNYLELREFCISKGYVFKSKTDSEVVLALYSLGIPNFEQQLEGMFAFAIYDLQKRQLILSRDRLGQKPLFYFENEQTCFFSSEIKALLPFLPEKKLNSQAISDFLSMGYVQGEQTPFENVHQVPAGHRLLFDQQGKSADAYWELSEQGETQGNSLSDWSLKVRSLFEQATRKRFPTEVPMGVFLSGGFDSNAVLGVLSKFQSLEKIFTYTIKLENRNYDESESAAVAAKKWGTQHKEITLKAADIAATFSDYVRSSDNLNANPASYAYFLLSRHAQKDVKVIFTGGGGDELFAGYPTYKANQIKRFTEWLPKAPTHGLAGLIRQFPSKQQKIGFRYKALKFIEGLHLPAAESHYHWRTIFTENEKKDLLKFKEERRPSHWLYSKWIERYSAKDSTNRYSIADLFIWWSNMGLYQADSTGMAHSIEIRVPMMDHKLVETAFQIPKKFKIDLFRQKIVFKKAAREFVPESLLDLKKNGFHIPLAEWFSGELKEFVLEKLSEDRIQSLDFIDYTAVTKILDDHFNKKSDNSFKINNLLVLVEWLHIYSDKRSKTR